MLQQAVEPYFLRWGWNKQKISATQNVEQPQPSIVDCIAMDGPKNFTYKIDLSDPEILRNIVRPKPLPRKSISSAFKPVNGVNRQWFPVKF